MKSKMQLLIVLTVVLLVPQVMHAQATSRVIPFNNVATTIAPGSPGQALTLQVWDDASPPTLQFSELQTLDVDANGNISFVLGALTSGGLDPNNFPSGSSRFLDVVDGTGASKLPNGRVALNATAFALSPGPTGPAGPAGPQGPPGPPGPVNSVTAGDTSISIGGSVANPTVAVATNGITNVNVANGALSPLKIAGTAATLGPNTFVGGQSITGPTGNLSVSGVLFSGEVITDFADIRGNTTVRGNGLDITIGNVGCGPPTAGIGAGFVTCATFALGMDSSTNSTFINRATGGAIHFKEGNAGTDQMTIASGGRVGIGTITPGARLDVESGSETVAILGFNSNVGVLGSSDSGVGVSGRSGTGIGVLGASCSAPGCRAARFAGLVEIDQLGTGGTTQLCSASGVISTCASSLRYKEQIASFTSGLELTRKLRPVTFRWKDGGERDLGLIAEEVNRVEPLLVTHNAQGEIEGVKYDRLSAVLINAIEEQQTEIQQQQVQIQQQQKLIKGLQKIVCRDHPQARMCH